MSPRRYHVLLTLATALGLIALSPVLGTGCGTAEPDVDKAALYTPESLAQEFASRFAGLNPSVKQAKTSYKARPLSAKVLAERERADRAKAQVLPEATKKKRAGPPTLDDLLADIDYKLNLLKGTTRGDACRRMAETIAKDSSLKADDKSALAELVQRLAEGS